MLISDGFHLLPHSAHVEAQGQIGIDTSSLRQGCEAIGPAITKHTDDTAALSLL
jgi:hypothetical protein